MFMGLRCSAKKYTVYVYATHRSNVPNVLFLHDKVELFLSFQNFFHVHVVASSLFFTLGL